MLLPHLIMVIGGSVSYAALEECYLSLTAMGWSLRLTEMDLAKRMVAIYFCTE